MMKCQLKMISNKSAVWLLMWLYFIGLHGKYYVITKQIEVILWRSYTQFRSIFWWNQNFYAFWHLEFGADSKPLAEDVVSLSYVRLPTRYTAMKGDISVNFNIGDRDLSNLTLSRLVQMSILSSSIEYQIFVVIGCLTSTYIFFFSQRQL